jgi:hypothetical protein
MSSLVDNGLKSMGKAPLKVWKEGDIHLGMITGPRGSGFGWKRDTVSFRLKFQKQEGNSPVYSGKHDRQVGNPYNNNYEWRDVTLRYFLIGDEEVFGTVMFTGGEQFKRKPGR